MPKPKHKVTERKKEKKESKDPDHHRPKRASSPSPRGCMPHTALARPSDPREPQMFEAAASSNFNSALVGQTFASVASVAPRQHSIVTGVGRLMQYTAGVINRHNSQREAELPVLDRIT